MKQVLSGHGTEIKANGRIAIVTGSDRGIGFEVSRQLGGLGYRVVLTSPNRLNGEAVTARLRRQGMNVVYHPLDVVNETQVRALRTFVVKEFGRADVLVNNAGVLLDEGRSKIEGRIKRILKKRPPKVDVGGGPSVLKVDMGLVRATLEINRNIIFDIPKKGGVR